MDTKNSFNFEKFISEQLQNYKETDPLYNTPIDVEDWCNNWDFTTYDANIYNHGLHQYPARFIPQLARKMIKTFCTSDSKVLDIFSGSGTTALECKYLGIKEVYGIELNPFATFMSKTKLQDIKLEEVTKLYEGIISDFKNSSYKYEIINFKNIDFWYAENIKKDLSKFLKIIVSIENQNIRNFYLLVFCELTRRDSFLDHGGFKMYRSRTKVQKNYNPNVLDDFIKTYQKNIKLLENNISICKNKEFNAHIIQGDSREKHAEIPDGSIDFILTSPPYGDSRTTVAYGQYSRLPWQWLSQKDDIILLDNSLLGGCTKNLDTTILEFSETLKKQVADVKTVDDSKRANDVIAFYNDLYKTMKNAYDYLKKNAFFVMVTGNRTVKKQYLRTDLIIKEFGNKIGFTTEKVLERKISNKRMAMKNSPTNEPGKTVSTMTTENMIFLRKN